MSAYKEFKEVWGGLPSISPHTEEAPGYTTGRVLSAMKIDADEISRLKADLEAVRSAVWDEAVAALVKQFAVEETVCLPAYRDGWADAIGCLKSLKGDMCHERPEPADGSVSAPVEPLQTEYVIDARNLAEQVVDQAIEIQRKQSYFTAEILSLERGVLLAGIEQAIKTTELTVMNGAQFVELHSDQSGNDREAE